MKMNVENTAIVTNLFILFILFIIFSFFMLILIVILNLILSLIFILIHIFILIFCKDSWKLGKKIFFYHFSEKRSLYFTEMNKLMKIFFYVSILRLQASQ